MYEDGEGGYDFIREGDGRLLPSGETDPRREGSPLGNAVRLVGRNKLIAMAAGVGVLGTGMAVFGVNDGGGVAGVGIGIEAVTAIFVWASARAIGTRPSILANPGPHRIAMAALGLGLLAGTELVGTSLFLPLNENRAVQTQQVGLSPEQQAQTVLVTSTAGSNSNNEAQAPGNTAAQASAKEPQVIKPADIPLEVWNKLTQDQRINLIQEKKQIKGEATPIPPTPTITRNPDSPSSVQRPTDIPLEVWNKLTQDQRINLIQEKKQIKGEATPTVSPEEAKKNIDQLTADAKKARDQRTENDKSVISKVPIVGPVLGPANDLASTGILKPLLVGLGGLLAWRMGLSKFRKWRKGQEGKPSLFSRAWKKMTKRVDGSGPPPRPPREEVDLSGSGGEFFQD